MSTQAGRHLSGRRKTSTQPEVLLRKALHAAGGRFRLHRTARQGLHPRHRLPRSSSGGLRRRVLLARLSQSTAARQPWTGPNAPSVGREDAAERGAGRAVHRPGRRARLDRPSLLGVRGRVERRGLGAADSEGAVYRLTGLKGPGWSAHRRECPPHPCLYRARTRLGGPRSRVTTLGRCLVP